MVAGRSCTKNIMETNRKSRQSATSSSPSYHLITENYDDNSAPASDGSELSEETTGMQFETVTNMFGEVVDEIPVTYPEEEITPTEDIPATTKSILGAYNESHTTTLAEGQTASRHIDIPEHITIHVG